MALLGVQRRSAGLQPLLYLDLGWCLRESVDLFSWKFETQWGHVSWGHVAYGY